MHKTFDGPFNSKQGIRKQELPSFDHLPDG